MSIHFKNGDEATEYHLECIARAFGFNSLSQFEAAARYTRKPSPLTARGEPEIVVDAAELARFEADRVRRNAAHEQRRQNSRDARNRVLERKAGAR